MNCCLPMNRAPPCPALRGRPWLPRAPAARGGSLALTAANGPANASSSPGSPLPPAGSGRAEGRPWRVSVEKVERRIWKRWVGGDVGRKGTRYKKSSQPARGVGSKVPVGGRCRGLWTAGEAGRPGFSMGWGAGGPGAAIPPSSQLLRSGSTWGVTRGSPVFSTAPGGKPRAH